MRTKVFKIVVKSTPRQRTFVMAAKLDEFTDEAEGWVDDILAATPNARLGDDRTQDNKATWRKRKKLSDPFQLKIRVADDADAVVQRDEVEQNRRDCVREPERLYLERLAQLGGIDAVVEHPETVHDAKCQERAKQGGDGAAKCQAIGWCSHCHGLDFSNRSSGAPGKKTTFTPKYVPIPGEETADNIAAQAAALEQFQNRQHLHTPTHKASGGLMQKLGEAAISTLGQTATLSSTKCSASSQM